MSKNTKPGSWSRRAGFGGRDARTRAARRLQTRPAAGRRERPRFREHRLWQHERGRPARGARVSRNRQRSSCATFVSDHEQGETPNRLMFAEGVGMLIALLDAGTLGRLRVVNRLRQLQHTDDFASLPEDLRERIREIIADAER